MTQKVSLRALKERCKVLETHVLRRGYVEHEELGLYRPGGPSNPGPRTTWAWVYWFAQLVRFSGREDTLGPIAGKSTGDADAPILDALRNEPKEVRLASQEPDPEHKGRTLKVYPKSLDALLQCHGLDHRMQWLTQKYDILRENGTAADMELLQRALAEMAYWHRIFTWIICTKGPRMPPDLTIDEYPDPPAWTEMSPYEMLFITKAHMEVNGERLQALEILIAPRKADPKATQRPSWSVFVGSMAVKMKVQPERLMKDYSLGELLAVVRLSAPPEPEPKEPGKRKVA